MLSADGHRKERVMEAERRGNSKSSSYLSRSLPSSTLPRRLYPQRLHVQSVSHTHSLCQGDERGDADEFDPHQQIEALLCFRGNPLLTSRLR
ncbi:hypothetical protein CesoFtcFv8_020348 [Champsocephalus esox]|uniref:Uncharacterized protein n=1 Tax=Champsocephalus esox TaxID=159716 RepID=A0AAN8BGI9_9TELE|nr:hypothetical protein CesoFtcFv8_020348 [Champsocephalus esox]